MAGRLHKHESPARALVCKRGGQVQRAPIPMMLQWLFTSLLETAGHGATDLQLLMGRTCCPALHFGFNGAVTNKGVCPLSKL